MIMPGSGIVTKMMQIFIVNMCCTLGTWLYSVHFTAFDTKKGFEWLRGNWICDKVNSISINIPNLVEAVTFHIIKLEKHKKLLSLNSLYTVLDVIFLWSFLCLAPAWSQGLRVFSAALGVKVQQSRAVNYIPGFCLNQDSCHLITIVLMHCIPR